MNSSIVMLPSIADKSSSLYFLSYEPFFIESYISLIRFSVINSGVSLVLPSSCLIRDIAVVTPIYGAA